MQQKKISSDIKFVPEYFLAVSIYNNVGSTEPLESPWDSQEQSDHMNDGGRYRCCLIVSGDGASWSTVVEEGEPVDTAGTGAATSSIRATTLGAG
ncbi:hypothetical protein Tco_0489730 [Tanacetum coccineum]